MGIIEKRLHIETEQDSCTLRLPKELAPASGEVIVRKEGERLIIEPAEPKGASQGVARHGAAGHPLPRHG